MEEAKYINLNTAILEYKKQKLNYKLPVVLGLNSDNKLEFANLVELKHLVLAGQTGSGKSMFEHTIINTFLSLMPSKIELFLVDMKRVEFGIYRDIPQLISNIIVESEDFFVKLEKLIEEKERRLLPENSDRKYSYIVAIIDTISDLVFSDRQRFDNLMKKLLIDADEAKIHINICDSRVGASVFTPTIMSMIPTKICFTTATVESSQCILGSDLGVHLHGKGDMLLKEDGKEAIRFQAPYIEDKEIEKIIKKIK